MVYRSLHHDAAVLGIECGGGLITDDEPRLMHQSTGDGDALLLTTGELGGAVFHAVPQSDTIEHLPRFLLRIAGGFPLDQERNADVLDAVQGRDEIKLLEDEADVLCTEARDGGLLHGAQIATEDLELAIIRLQRASDDADERGFPTTRRSDEHGDVTAANVEIDALQDLKPRAAISKTTGDPAKLCSHFVLGVWFLDGNIGHNQ